MSDRLPQEVKHREPSVRTEAGMQIDESEEQWESANSPMRAA
jgi:hypothetical protein